MDDLNENDDFKTELQKMYNESMDHLQKAQHDRVQELFNYFFNNDMRLKEKLAKAFMPDEDGNVTPMDPEKMQSLIELQATYNAFHLNLFNTITDYLIEKFKEALQVMDQNLEEGSKISFEVQKTVRFYEVKLDKLMAPIDTFQGSTYNDLKASYEAVTNRRNEMITQSAQKVIAKEQELMMQQQ